MGSLLHLPARPAGEGPSEELTLPTPLQTLESFPLAKGFPLGQDSQAPCASNGEKKFECFTKCAAYSPLQEKVAISCRTG